MNSNYDKYEDIYHTICIEHALGYITLEEAERINDLAYEKYMTEKNQLDYYDDRHNANPDEGRLFANHKDVAGVAADAGRYITNPNTIGGKVAQKISDPVVTYNQKTEQLGRKMGQAVMKKPPVDNSKLVEAYNKKLNIWGKTVKVGAFLGPYLSIYALTPLAVTVPKTAAAKLAGGTISSAVSPTTHIGMEIGAAQDKDIQAIAKWIADKTAPLRNKVKQLCQKYQDQQVTPQIKGEFDKVNAQGLAAIKQASMGALHESAEDINEDLVGLFEEAGRLFEEKSDAVFYAINHADFSNPEVVNVVNEYIEKYM